MIINKFKTIDKQYNELPKKVIFVRIVLYLIRDQELNLIIKVFVLLVIGVMKKILKLIGFLEINNL